MRNIDWDYVNRMNQLNDGVWKDYEKWFYYNYDNQNYIIPTIILNIIMFFTNPPGKNIIACIVITCLMLYLCHLNNVKLDNDPRIIQSRKNIRESRMKRSQKENK